MTTPTLAQKILKRSVISTRNEEKSYTYDNARVLYLAYKISPYGRNDKRLRVCEIHLHSAVVGDNVNIGAEDTKAYRHFDEERGEILYI